MPVSFSDDERQTIQNSLLQKGKELFGRYGLRRTSISDLTKAAGIAQGSFYLFYESKEELYFDILEREEQHLAEVITNNLSQEKLTRKGLKKSLQRSLDLICENAFIKTLVENDEYRHLIRKIPAEKMSDHLLAEYRLIGAVSRRFRKEGRLRKVRPEVLGGLLYALFLLNLDREDIGEGIFPEVMGLFIDALADALATKGTRNCI